MSKKDEPKYRPISVPFTPEEHAAILRRAQENLRSMGQTVRLLTVLALKKGSKP
jgi:hypothetical protein